MIKRFCALTEFWLAGISKFKHRSAIIGAGACLCLLTIFLPMTASAESDSFNGNPFIGTTTLPSSGEYPRLTPLKGPALNHGTLPVIDLVTLPSEPKPAASLNKENVAMQTVTGFLHRVGAVGSESTGWAIRLDKPLKVSPTSHVSKIEVDADGSLLVPLQDSQVEARGRINWRHGIERGQYPVMMLESIQRQ